MTASSWVFPVSDTIVSTIRSALSVTHFCARRRTFARPSKPSASHAGWAARARATIARTSSALATGTVATTSPVAGFATGMPSATEVDGCSTVAMRMRLLEREPLDDRRLLRAVARVGRERLEGVDDVHARGHLAEHRVLAVEPGRGVLGDDEELGAVRVRAGVGHGQRAADDLVIVELVLERVAGAAGARALRAAALDHEVLDHAVEDEPVVEAVARELLEVRHRLGRVLVEELEGDRALAGGHGRLGHGPEASRSRAGALSPAGTAR